MFGSQRSHNAAATWYVKRCRVSAFGTSTMNGPEGTLKSAAYIGSEENKIMRAIKRWFISDSGASGPSCASITINHYPNAATRPQQVKPHRHAHTPLKKTRLFAPQFLSFTYPSFLSTRTVPPKIPIISPDATGHTALLYLSFAVPVHSETNRIRHVARNQHKSPSRLVAACLTNFTLPTSYPHPTHPETIISCFTTPSSIPLDYDGSGRERHARGHQETRENHRAPEELLWGLLCPQPHAGGAQSARLIFYIEPA